MSSSVHACNKETIVDRNTCVAIKNLRSELQNAINNIDIKKVDAIVSDLKKNDPLKAVDFEIAQSRKDIAEGRMNRSRMKDILGALEKRRSDAWVERDLADQHLANAKSIMDRMDGKSDTRAVSDKVINKLNKFQKENAVAIITEITKPFDKIGPNVARAFKAKKIKGILERAEYTIGGGATEEILDAIDYSEGEHPGLKEAKLVFENIEEKSNEANEAFNFIDGKYKEVRDAFETDKYFEGGLGNITSEILGAISSFFGLNCTAGDIEHAICGCLEFSKVELRDKCDEVKWEVTSSNCDEAVVFAKEAVELGNSLQFNFICGSKNYSSPFFPGELILTPD